MATGILNIWRHDAADVAAETERLRDGSGDRFVLGLGVSHSRMIGDEYVAPLAKMTATSTSSTPPVSAPGCGCWPRCGHECSASP